MGEAKRRKAAAGSTGLTEAVSKVGRAIQALASAASTHLGSDCVLHAVMGQALLAELGHRVVPCVGYAAWRVGAGDGDVISHMPQPGYLPPGAEGFGYHAWLISADRLSIDLTTYQLRHKAAVLDAADGGQTAVEWCPPYLILPPTEIRSYRQVAQAPNAGVCYYEPRPELISRVLQTFQLAPDDLAHARLLLNNPTMHVMGPNDLLSR